jgi:hypothetical protein
MKKKHNKLVTTGLISAFLSRYNLRLGFMVKGIITPAWFVACMVVLLAQVSMPALATCPDSTIELSTLNGQNGIIINTEIKPSLILQAPPFLTGVSTAGDVNGDGYDDVLIGDIGAANFLGSAYVIFGGPNLNISTLDLAGLNGQNGFVIRGVQQTSFNQGSFLIRSVSTAGDVNGDGFDDLIFGDLSSLTSDGYFSGNVVVIFGGSNIGANGSLDITTLDSNKGFVIEGVRTNTSSTSIGKVVKSAGDFNGDGFDDLLFSKGYITQNDAVYVVFGSSNIGSMGTMKISDIDGSNGFVIDLTDVTSQGRRSFSTAGDINNDGLDDILSSHFVVFGTRHAITGSVIEPASLDGQTGFQIQRPGRIGIFSVNAVGDINNDGIDDVILGSSSSSTSAYVVYGGAGIGAGGALILNSASISGANGFLIQRPVDNDALGNHLNGSGDFNGDGIDDLLLGGNTSTNGVLHAGKTYIVVDSSTVSSNGLLQLSTQNSLAFIGENMGDVAGVFTSYAGDVNGDGNDDILIAAPGANNGNGTVYLVFGKKIFDPPGELVAQLTAGVDDAEEDSSGLVSRASSTLNLGEMLTGIRFPTVNIPSNANVACAYIQFESTGVTERPAAFQVVGETSGFSPPFRFSTNNLSSRPTTSAVVTWLPESWSYLNTSGFPHETNNLSSIVQEIISHPDWSIGNPLTFLIENGGGRRLAVSYNQESRAAAKLYVKYTLTSAETQVIEARVTHKHDDAEEHDDTTIRRVSTDLELGFDKTRKQTVGIRFSGINIPRGSTITKAYIQFQADEANSDTANLLIEGEATDHARRYKFIKENISARTLTQTSVSWVPPSWTLVGEAGIKQRTPDISSIVQEVLDRPGWQSSNALGFVITGTGHRTAESFDGVSSAAPLLHLEYNLP